MLNLEKQDASQPLLNPWFSMWTKPRATMQQIIEHDPKHMVMMLVIASGFSNALDRASMQSLGDSYDWPYIILMAMVAGPIAGVVGLYVFSTLLVWTGKWLDGKAPIEHIQSAIAWSTVPIVWGLLLWPPALLLFGQELFTDDTPIISSNPGLLAAFLLYLLIEFLLAIWSLVVLLKCLAQVQQFSAWKALGNALMAILVIVIPIILLVMVLI